MQSDTPSSAGDYARDELIESSLPLAFENYDAAMRDGVKSPVVFLVDCEDAIGRELAEAWVGAKVVAETIESVRLEFEDDAASDAALTTMLARAVPWAECRDEVPSVFPYLGSVVAKEPAGDAFLAIVVSDGGASAFSVPLSARP